MAEKKLTAGRKKANRFFFFGLLILIAAAIIGGISGAAVAVGVKNASLNKRKECVLKIGEKEVSREQFELFCITVIEGSGFEAIEAGTASENALANAVKTRASEYARQYIALTTEAEKTGITLSPLERAEIDFKVEDIPKGEEITSYYIRNYGVTEEGYRDFLAGWKLCEKYINTTADGITPDEDMKRTIFEANAEKLGWGLADVIYFDISSSDSGDAELKRSTAGKICDTVNGVPDDDKERIFKSFYDNFNEQGFGSSGINVALTGDVAADHPVLFEAVRKAVEGYCYVVDDQTAVFAVRVRERFMFDFYKNSEELALIVRDEIRRQVAEDTVNDGVYNVFKTQAFDTVNVKPLIAARKELNGR